LTDFDIQLRCRYSNFCAVSTLYCGGWTTGFTWPRWTPDATDVGCW